MVKIRTCTLKQWKKTHQSQNFCTAFFGAFSSSSRSSSTRDPVCRSDDLPCDKRALIKLVVGAIVDEDCEAVEEDCGKEGGSQLGA
jgi:hypothetical protein